MGPSPLQHPQLFAIEQALDQGELDEAQQRLADLGDVQEFGVATAYLVTRLLYERGRISLSELVERLRDLLKSDSAFPEAAQLLRAAEAGVLVPRSLTRSPSQSDRGSAPGTRQPASIRPRRQSSAGSQGPDPTSSSPAGSGAVGSRPGRHHPPIPRAPNLPDVGVVGGVGLSRPSNSPEPSFNRTRPRSSQAPPRRSGRPLPARESFPSSPLGLEPATRLERARRLVQVRRFREAAQLIGEPSSAEEALVKAEALSALSLFKDAAKLLKRVCDAPLLEPPVRARTAQLLLELDDVETALHQAQRAHQDEPFSPHTRVALAQVLARWALSEARKGSESQVQMLIEDLKAREVDQPALLHSLRAFTEALSGDAERAISSAQLALKSDPRALEAFAAVALASARLGRAHDAQQAFLSVAELNQRFAELLQPLVSQQGVRVNHLSTSQRPSLSEPSSQNVWPPLELALLSGEQEVVSAGIENLCANLLTERGLAYDTAGLGRRAAQIFNQTPVLCHFAPFDLSLWSLRRLEAVIQLVHDPRSEASSESSLRATELVMGAYFGETLRRAFGGVWDAPSGASFDACVHTSLGYFPPFLLVQSRLKGGLALDHHIPRSAEADEAAWQRFLPSSELIPSPWHPAEWPEANDLMRYGRAMSRSVVSLFCGRQAEGALERSIAGLSSMDSYLNLVSPIKGPPPAAASWTQRLSILLGAYLGETLRESYGGAWVTSTSVGFDAYRLHLGRTVITPVQFIHERLTHERLTNSVEYARRVIQGLT